MKCPEPIDILIFTDWYLPGYKAGGPIVSITNMVKALQAHRRIAVVCSDRDYLSGSPYSGIAANIWQQKDDAWVYYLSPALSTYTHIADLIRNNETKVLYINGMFSKVYSIYPLLAARRGRQRIVLAPRGMLAPGAMGIKPLRKRVFLAFAKILGLYRKIELHATHAHEAEHVRRHLGGNLPIKVLANLPSFPEKEPLPRAKTPGLLRVLIVARVAREKNLHFALECLVEASKTCEIHLSHIGPVYDEAYAAQCLDIAAQGKLRVDWLGALPPAEIQRQYAQAALFFLPSLGENFGHAIAEALLHGLPVLTSDQTPWRNLKEEGWGADFPLDVHAPYVNYICALAGMDAVAYSRMTNGISAGVRKHLGVAKTTAAYKAYFA